ncbi:4-phosphopantetheinyl transferase [Brevibacillus panacihumi W25]|uniref:4-phosphopantetheinyl transferase n=1 Tax=Brevibacillus panacihumi W25 TaxID=1408254 RepID=V6MC13_9BACL|nr:4-phosphopantetheinyl transferase [Brevibacillus panacihumi W25]
MLEESERFRLVNVYAVRVPSFLEQDVYHFLLMQIAPEKRLRVHRFHRQADAYRAVLADVLIRSILAQSFGLSNEQISFQVTRYGKPFVEQLPDFHFNLSHSGDWVVCATSNAPVGIDIEHIRPIEIDVAKRFFSCIEYEDLLAQPREEQLAYFYDLWTLKESYLKALGMGLSKPLNSFSIRRTEGEKFHLVLQSKELLSWFLRQYEIDVGYKLSICSRIPTFCDEIKYCYVENILPKK